MASNKLNFLFYSAGIAVSGLLSFLFIPVVVQLYGKDVYGTYTIVFNTLSVVCMFCYAWVGQSYIRFFSKIGTQLLQVSKQLLLKSLLLGFGVFMLLGYCITNTTTLQLILFAPTFFLFGYYCFLLLVFQAQQKAKLIMLCEVVRTALNIIAAIVFFKIFNKQYALELLAVALFISYLIPTTILILKSSNKTAVVNEGNKHIVKQLLGFGIPIAFFLSGSLALSVNDRILISFFIDKETAGTYSAIYDIINKGVIAVFSPILMTFYPVIAAHYNKGEKQQAFKKLQKTIWLEVGLMLIGLVALLFVCSYLLQIVFKQPMPQSLNTVSYLVFVGVCLWQLAMLVHKPLELLEQTKYMAIAVFVALLFNFIANYLLLQYSSNLVYPAITTIGGSVVYILLVKLFQKKYARSN